MKPYFLFLFSICAHITINAQELVMEWVKHYEGKSWVVVRKTTVDESGNVYATGDFTHAINLDKDKSNFTLTASGANDGFVTKTDKCGNLIWAKQYKAKSQIFPFSISLDLDGNVYTTGWYSGNGISDFDPETGNHILNQGAEIFVVKHDSAGNVIWAKRIGGSSTMFSSNISVDAAGNLLICGNFRGTGDFNPGTGVHKLTSVGNNDGYLVKLSPSGQFIWAKQFTSENRVNIFSAKFDINGFIYTTGSFSGNTNFEPGNNNHRLISDNNVSNIFVCKQDINGKVVWVIEYKSTNISNGLDIIIDNQLNIYLTGSFSGTVDFNFGQNSIKFTSKGNRNAFITKLNSSGNLIWAKQLSGDIEISGNGIDLDSSYNVYTTGSFKGTVDFNPGTENYYLTSNGGDKNNQFILKLNNDGYFQWAVALLSSGLSTSQSINVSKHGIYTGGVFSGTVDFQTGLGNHFLTTNSGNHGFVHKINLIDSGNIYGKKHITGCEGEPLILTPFYYSGSNFQWSTGETTPTISVTDSGIYYVQVDYCNQTFYDSIHVKFGPKPLVYIGQDTSFCGSVDYIINSETKDAKTYTWNTGDTTKILYVDKAGIYSLTVKGENSCENADTVQVDKIDYPENFKDNEIKVCWDKQLILDAQNPGSSYLWSTGENSQTIVVSNSGIYHVTISNHFCSISDSVDVIFLTEEECSPYIYVPNAFSPNNDGINDYFIVVGQNMNKFDLQIFNRWGQMIYNNANINFKWDGNFNGHLCPDGLYTVVILYETNLEPGKTLIHKSNLHLIR